jgi:peptide-methionine (R)-S-oxide reductase
MPVSTSTLFPASPSLFPPRSSTPVAKDNVVEIADRSHRMVRTEVRSSHGDSHLGHVFNDGPPDQGGLRYCINSASLRFIPLAELQTNGYGEYIKLFDGVTEPKEILE